MWIFIPHRAIGFVRVNFIHCNQPNTFRIADDFSSIFFFFFRFYNEACVIWDLTAKGIRDGARSSFGEGER